MTKRVIVLAVLLVVVVAYAVRDRSAGVSVPTAKVAPAVPVQSAGVAAPEASAEASAALPPAVAGHASPQAPAALSPSPRPAPRAVVEPPATDKPAAPRPRREKPVPPPYALVAREALAFVGTDADANAYWHEVINDPTLDPETRSDLIEDLNEDGFADPKNLTAEDLPLIMSRLALIEALAPSAMDDVNYAAFAEAYKDLLNMQAKLVAP